MRESRRNMPHKLRSGPLLLVLVLVALAVAAALSMWVQYPIRVEAPTLTRPQERDSGAEPNDPPAFPLSLDPDEVTIDHQTRTVVAGLGVVEGFPATHTVEISAETTRIVVGYLFRSASSPPVRLVVTAGSEARPFFQTMLTSGGRTSWQDVTFPVSRSRAGVLTLSLESDSPHAQVAMSRPAIVGREERPDRPKNLILISLDTVRADYLGLYGMTKHPTSPFLDGLGERGTVFEKAIAPSPWTVPSHMALLTGIDPDSLGMAHFVGRTPRLSAKRTTLAEVFAEAGYLTVAFTGRGTMSARNGFADGFFIYQESTVDTDFVFADLDDSVYAARQWLKANRAEPFFLFFHTFEAHAPYSHGRFLTEGDELSRSKQAYASGIAYVDERLGEFFEDLERLGVLDDTLVIVTSDHGEAFEEHPPHRLHGRMLYDEVLHVPLIFSGPTVEGGRRIESQVGLIDVFATLIDLFDLPPPEPNDSVSLRPLLEGGTIEARRVYLCCLAHDRQQLGIRTGEWKYFFDSAEGSAVPGGTQGLYALGENLSEQNDLVGSRANIAAELREEILGRSVPNWEAAKAVPLGPQRVDHETLEQLRALGYIE